MTDIEKITEDIGARAYEIARQGGLTEAEANHVRCEQKLGAKFMAEHMQKEVDEANRWWAQRYSRICEYDGRGELTERSRQASMELDAAAARVMEK